MSREMMGCHVSRTWSKTDKQQFPDCPCAIAACGLIVPNVECPEHGLVSSKTIRLAHHVDYCPATPPQPRSKRGKGSRCYFCGKFTPEDGLSDQSECADCRGLNDSLIEAQWVEALSEGAAWTESAR